MVTRIGRGSETAITATPPARLKSAACATIEAAIQHPYRGSTGGEIGTSNRGERYDAVIARPAQKYSATPPRTQNGLPGVK